MDTNPLPPTAPPEDAAGQLESRPSPVLAPHAPRELLLRDVFLGPKGIYPGVRWLIYLGLAWLTYNIAGGLILPLRPSYGAPIWWDLIAEAIRMAAAILPAFLMARIEMHPFADFGLPARTAFRRNFWMGTLWGIAGVTALMLILRLAGAFEFGSLALHGTRIVKFALYHAAFFLVVGFFEEFLLRGYSQWVLTRAMNFWPTAVLLSFGFGAIHAFNPSESKIGLAAAGLIGFFLCLTLRRTGDLWWAVGFHMSWDWGESYLYSVPDSGEMSPGHLLNSSFHGPVWLTGGTVGPEGSVLVFVVIAALWVLFDRMYPEVKYGKCWR